MTNAERILAELDSRLSVHVELTLYGRAALGLGYEAPPAEFAQSVDVDVILAPGQAEALLESTNFWEAIEETNGALAETGLYVSHLFMADQVILTGSWQDYRVRVDGPWCHLELYRLGDEDLLLSKLMRDDPHDRGDALFIANRAGIGVRELEELLNRAVVPESAEIAEQFRAASQSLIRSLESEES